MAIDTDSAVEFFGTQDTVTNSSSSVANNAYSVSGDITTWTNDDNAPMASMVLFCAFGTAPTANRTVTLYAALQNIDGSNDQSAPDDESPHVYLGAFPVNNVTSNQYIPIDILLPNTKESQPYDFYVRNNAGQTMSAGWTLKITPKTIGPHA